MNNLISIIIPCYNEENTIVETLGQVNKLNLNKRIIVVDDGSEDNTYSKIRQYSTFEDIVLLRHRINLGKGAALKTGCEAALRLGTDTIVFIDADQQHFPDDILRLVEKLKKEKLDIVFGTRNVDKKQMPLLSYLGNKFLTKLTCFLSNITLNDVQSGFKVFTSQTYQKIAWQSCGYSVENEIIINTGKYNLKYGQVPIKTIYKDTYKGTTVFSGLKIFLNILKQKFL